MKRGWLKSKSRDLVKHSLFRVSVFIQCFLWFRFENHNHGKHGRRKKTQKQDRKIDFSDTFFRIMNETCEKAEEFLSGLVADMRFDMRVSATWTDEGCVLNLSGNDAHMALAENGEMLDAFEVLLFQIFGRELDREHRFVVDADGYRQTRKAELHAMARFAGDQVRKNGRPFTFGVLNSTERRIIHLTLQQEEDLDTQSVGDGRERRLQVRLK